MLDLLHAHLLEGDPDRARQLPGLVDAGGAHHEPGHGIGSLHDAGADDVEDDTDEDVRALEVADNIETDPQRHEVEERHEGPRIAPHLRSDEAEEENGAEEGGDDAAENGDEGGDDASESD